MSFLIRVTRPSDPSFLLRVVRNMDLSLREYEEVYFERDATPMPSIELARAVVQQLLDARPDSTKRDAQIAWKFKQSVLSYKPWMTEAPAAVRVLTGESLIPDPYLTPKGWEEKVIEGAQIAILEKRSPQIIYSPVEIRSLEMPKPVKIA